MADLKMLGDEAANLPNRVENSTKATYLKFRRMSSVIPVARTNSGTR